MQIMSNHRIIDEGISMFDASKHILVVYGGSNNEKSYAPTYIELFDQMTEFIGTSGLPETIQMEDPDIIILDIETADAGIIDACRVIRAYSNTPMLVIGEEDDEQFVINVLDSGADDYIQKPTRTGELLARARAAVRRYYATNSDLVVNLGSLTVDLDARRIKVHGEDVHFTPTEFALIAELTRQLDKVVAHERLIRQVWGSNYKGSKQYLYVYFGRIRQKLGDVYSDYIETIPGAGYMLRSEPAS